MSTAQTWQTVSTSSDATSAIAARVGKKLRGGEVIELVSDLGGGKTTFVRGLAAGMGSKDRVSSPSFTLNNQYRAGRLTLYHFDFHRIDDPGIMREELGEILADPDSIVVIEWADIVKAILPPDRLTITIISSGENERQLSFNYPDELNYLVPKSI